MGIREAALRWRLEGLEALITTTSGGLSDADSRLAALEAAVSGLSAAVAALEESTSSLSSSVSALLARYDVEAYTATTDGSGYWSVDLSSEGWTSVVAAVPVALSDDETAAEAQIATLSEASTAGVAGGVVERTTVVLGGTTLQSVGAGIEVGVVVFGTRSGA